MKSGSSEMKSMLSTIVEKVDNDELVEVTEKEFTETYLPIALGVHSNLENVPLYIWANRAKNIHLGLKVVNTHTKELLYITPGLFIKSSFSIKGSFSSLMEDLGHHQKNKLDQGPVFAKHLNSENAKLAFESSSEHTLDWYRIFSRYGYKMEKVVEGKDTPSEPTPSPKAIEEQTSSSVEWDDDEFA